MRARITDQSSSLGLQREKKIGSKWKRWAGLSARAAIELEEIGSFTSGSLATIQRITDNLIGQCEVIL